MEHSVQENKEEKADIQPPPPPPIPGEDNSEEEPSKEHSHAKKSSKKHTPEKKVNPFVAQKRREQRKQLLYITGILAAALFIFYGAARYLTRGGILILEPDKNFTLTLNGKSVNPVQRDDGVYIKAVPGQYRLQLSRADYAPFTADIRVKRGQIVRLRPIYSVLPKSTEQASTTVDYVRPSLDQKAVFYLGNNRQTIYRVELSNQEQIPLTLQPLSGVRDIQWSTDTDLALIELADGTYLQEIPRYDFTSQIKIKIAGTDVHSAVWDPNNSDRLAFAYAPSSGEHSLVFSDKHLTYMDRKADISAIPNPLLIWSATSDSILLRGTSGDMDQNNIWLYKTSTGLLTQLTQGGNVLDATFSPDGATILYETYDASPSNTLGSTLHTVGIDGKNQKTLKVSGKVAQAAWKDNSSFYLPEAAKSALLLYMLDGKESEIPFSFPQTAIQGMHYFSSNKTLIFYTSSSIYLADLSK